MAPLDGRPMPNPSYEDSAMSIVSRRDFLAQAAAAGTVALTGIRTLAAPAPQVVKGTDRVELGPTKVPSTILGVGTGTHGGREQRHLGQSGFTRMIRHAYERGIRYIDTADMYMTHMFVRFAKEGLPRDELFIQTKTRAKHPEVAKADIKRFLRELKTNYIDSLLMHAMGTGTWPTDMRPVMDVLYEAKKRGQVRAVGISHHGFDPLVASIDADWIDVHLVRINPFGVKMDDTDSAKVAAQIQKMPGTGRGVIGMKIFGEDGLGSRQRRLESLKYVLGLGCVNAFTIGFTSPKQIDETLDLIEEASTELALSPPRQRRLIA
jgi:hypothetical protein